jgi:hypothetical protein
MKVFLSTTLWETGEGVEFHTFLTPALDGTERLASRSGRYTSEQIVPGTHWIGD